MHSQIIHFVTITAPVAVAEGWRRSHRPGRSESVLRIRKAEFERRWTGVGDADQRLSGSCAHWN